MDNGAIPASDRQDFTEMEDLWVTESRPDGTVRLRLENSDEGSDRARRKYRTPSAEMQSYGWHFGL